MKYQISRNSKVSLRNYFLILHHNLCIGKTTRKRNLNGIRQGLQNWNLLWSTHLHMHNIENINMNKFRMNRWRDIARDFCQFPCRWISTIELKKRFGLSFRHLEENSAIFDFVCFRIAINIIFLNKISYRHIQFNLQKSIIGRRSNALSLYW